MRHILLLSILAAAVAVPGCAGTVTFTLDPLDGQLYGGAGTSVGWGYRISTDADWVTIDSFTLVDFGASIGTWQDVGHPATAASAGSDILVAWSANFEGLQYDIFNTQHLGDATRVSVFLSYNTYSDAGLTTQTGFSDLVQATLTPVGDGMAGVEVDAEVATPEPSTGLLLGGALAAAWALRRRRA